jgi:trehalose 6-phosphate synthase
MNQALADAVADEASMQPEIPPIVMVHDYHLYLAPAFIRERMRDASILHFVHIPWPAPRYWLLLPQIMRHDICDSLCASDIVGFQTTLDAQNFLFTCEWTLPEATVDYANSTVEWRGRKTSVRAYPISIDPVALRDLSFGPRVQRYLGALTDDERQTIVRVDRMEPSKNIIRGFRAYEMLLERHPELLGKVRFLAFIVPSRTNLQHYKNYSQQVRSQIDSINNRFGTSDWLPIRLFYEDNYEQAIAGLSISDVLLVNPVMDGMNLVAKEGPTVNTRGGVLILSESAGAFAQLGKFALPVSAADLEATSNALYTALTMAPSERRRRAQQLRKCIAEEDITLWLWWQMQDVKRVQAARAAAAALD